MSVRKELFFFFTDLHQNVQVRKYFSFVEKSQWWSTDEIKSYQEEKLIRIINYAYQHVEYYNQLFNSLKLKPVDFKQVADLKKLPVLTRRIIKTNRKKLISSDQSLTKHQMRQTGGTTGEPLTFYSNMESWSLHWALKLRAWEWAGYNFGDKIAVMAGASLLPEQKASFRRSIWNYLLGLYPMSMTHASDDDLLKYYNIIRKEKIKCIRGYPTSVANFARYIKLKKISLNLNAVITTAEVLQVPDREIMEEVFNCRVFDHYGCSDGGGIATECNHHTGMHICPEASIWEFDNKESIYHNDEPVSEILLTSLTNYSMPFIRYSPGDLAVSKGIKCSCGRQTTLIDKIIGRTTEVIRFGNGRTLAGPAFTLIFRRFNLEHYQIVQKEINTLDVNIIPGSSFDKTEIKEIQKIMEFHCGKGVKVNINVVEQIDNTKSGKFRFIISEVS